MSKIFSLDSSVSFILYHAEIGALALLIGVDATVVVGLGLPHGSMYMVVDVLQHEFIIERKKLSL